MSKRRKHPGTQGKQSKQNVLPRGEENTEFEGRVDLERVPWKTAGLLVGASLVALAASVELVLSEITHLRNPTGSLSCDLNPLIGCSSSLMTWQAHLMLGIPNALVGVALYAGLTGVFLAWLGGRLPRWLPLTIEAGLTASLALIIFFLQQSVTFFRTLCPFCLLVWGATILIWIHLGATLMRLGHLPWLPPGFQKFWTQQRWLLTISAFLLIFLVIAVMLPDKLMYLF